VDVEMIGIAFAGMGIFHAPLTPPFLLSLFPRFPRRTEELIIMSRRGKIAYEVNRCFRSKCTSAEEVCVLFPCSPLVYLSLWLRRKNTDTVISRGIIDGINQVYCNEATPADWFAGN